MGDTLVFPGTFDFTFQEEDFYQEGGLFSKVCPVFAEDWDGHQRDARNDQRFSNDQVRLMTDMIRLGYLKQADFSSFAFTIKRARMMFRALVSPDCAIVWIALDHRWFAPGAGKRIARAIRKNRSLETLMIRGRVEHSGAMLDFFGEDHPTLEGVSFDTLFEEDRQRFQMYYNMEAILAMANKQKCIGPVRKLNRDLLGMVAEMLW